MRITLLGCSSSIGSLLLESARALYGWVEVTIIENVPRADDDPFVPEGMDVRMMKAEALTERPIGPFLLAMAKPEAKRATWAWFADRFGLQREELTTLISPHAMVASTATIGRGVYVEPGVVISPFANVEDMATINRGATIGHHTRVGEFVNIGPGCHIAGHCHLGASVQLGVGTVTFDHVSVGNGTMIGGGSVVVKDVPPNVVAWGNPCAVVKERVN
ncbi:MAG: acetyltransferase [Flavobacteriales bacterium]